jgi:hypothetical protein
VPTGANYVVAFFSHWDDNGGSSLASLELNGAAFAFVSQTPEGDTTNENGQGVAVLATPATGEQTLAWAWSAGGARSEGGEIILVYIADANIGDAVQGADDDANTETNPAAVTLTTADTDLVLAFAANFTDVGGDPDPDPGLNGSEFLDGELNSHNYELAEIAAGDGSTAVTMTAGRYPSLAAIALKVAVAGGEAGDITEGAEAGEAFGAVATAAATVTAGAMAGDGPSALAQLAATIAEGVHAGDAWVATAAAVADLVDAAIAAEDWDALAAAATTFAEGVEVGDAWSGLSAATETGTITAGAEVGDAFTPAAAAFASVLEGVVAGGTVGGAALASAAWTAGVLAGDHWTAVAQAGAGWSAAAQAGDAFAEAQVQIARILRTTVTLLTVHHVTRTVRSVASTTVTVRPSSHDTV